MSLTYKPSWASIKDPNKKFWAFYKENKDEFEKILWNACWSIKRKYNDLIHIDDMHSDMLLRMHRSDFLNDYDSTKSQFGTFVMIKVNGYARHYITSVLKENFVVEDVDGVLNYTERFEGLQVIENRNLGHDEEIDQVIAASEMYSELLSNLNDLQKTIANTYFADGYSLGGVAEIFNMSISQVNWHLSVIRNIFLKEVESVSIRKKSKAKPVKKVETDNRILFCEIKGVRAKGYQTSEGFLVKKGSEAVLNERNTVKKWPWPLYLRNSLKAEGVLVLQNDRYVFTCDKVFASRSAAASAVHGGHADPKSWK